MLPLTDTVHFPHTDLALDGDEPAFRRMVRDVIDKEESPRWIGIVLTKPGGKRGAPPDIFPEGTAGRILDSDFRADGHTEVVLHGEFRFELRQELILEPYREAVVHPLTDPWLNERDAGLVAVRTALLTLLRSLAEDLKEHFPIQRDEVDALAGKCFFEELINHVAAEIDVPARRKLELLHAPIPERGLSLLSILQGRRDTVDLLRTFRHLLRDAQLN